MSMVLFVTFCRISQTLKLRIRTYISCASGIDDIALLYLLYGIIRLMLILSNTFGRRWIVTVPLVWICSIIKGPNALGPRVVGSATRIKTTTSSSGKKDKSDVPPGTAKIKAGNFYSRHFHGWNG